MEALKKYAKEHNIVLDQGFLNRFDLYWTRELERTHDTISIFKDCKANGVRCYEFVNGALEVAVHGLLDGLHESRKEHHTDIVDDAINAVSYFGRLFMRNNKE